MSSGATRGSGSTQKMRPSLPKAAIALATISADPPLSVPISMYRAGRRQKVSVKSVSRSARVIHTGADVRTLNWSSSKSD